MSKKYATIEESVGYTTKRDETNTDERSLVAGSVNVLINDGEKVSTRKGFTLQSAEDTSGNPIESSFDWETSSNSILNLRSYDDELEVYLGTVDGVAVNAWTRIADGFSAVDFIYDSWWDSTEGIDLLLLVNGDSNMRDWSGCVAVVDSVTANTITKKGTTTWAEARALANGTRRLKINGVAYTYTGGEGTDTLTGVTPNPLSNGVTDGDIAIQEIRTNANTPASGFKNDTIRVQNNQVCVGSNTSRDVYVSSNTDFTDYTFSTPRVPGEGALLTLDATTNGFGRFKNAMVIFSGRDFLYKTRFNELDVGGTLTEILTIDKLKTSKGQSAQSQDLIIEIGDQIAFVTFEPALRILSDVENVLEPQIRTHSNPIKPDFDAEDFTGGQLFFDKSRICVVSKVNSKLYLLEIREDANGKVRRFWQPPQLVPASRLSHIGGTLHMHSNVNAETHKLFDGTSDNGASFRAVAAWAYRSFGDRVNLKKFDELYVEGYISSNTKLQVTAKYEFEGVGDTQTSFIDGSDRGILLEPPVSGSLGDENLGDEDLGGGASGENQNPKFKTILSFAPTEFTESQFVFETDDLDLQWELLAHGPNVLQSPSNNISIIR